VYDSASQVGNLQTHQRAHSNWTFRNNLFINMDYSFTMGIPNTKIYNNTFWNTNFVMVATQSLWEDKANMPKFLIVMA